jgi:hypothetical protein
VLPGRSSPIFPGMYCLRLLAAWFTLWPW